MKGDWTMRETIMPAALTVPGEWRPGLVDKWSKGVLFRILEGIGEGCVIVSTGAEVIAFGCLTADFPHEVTITVRDPRFFSAAVLGGSIGVAEAFMAGHWEADDLTTLIRIVIRNERVFEGMDRGWAWVKSPIHRLYHMARRNTTEGSKLNISAHYDLGNDFYALFLDGTMTYSCGIFEELNSTMEDASIAKIDRICRKLNLSSRDHVLEIGTGWGGFAIHAAANYGCRVTTTTLSRAQWDLACERIRAAGLKDRVEVLLRDYRNLAGQYDKLVSIEMIEAVGHHYLDAFFAACSKLLKDEGEMLLQAITIRDQVFDRHKHSVDFIKRYIFPGSCIPSVAAMSQAVSRFTDLRLFHLEDITPNYVRTLRAWRTKFLDNMEAVRRLGYSKTFIRMWEYYLCYCEAGFAERYLGDVQMLFTKPRSRKGPILPGLSRG